MSRTLGIIICSLLVAPMLAGEVSALSISFENSMVDSVQKAPSRTAIGKRRDPFIPIKKPRSLVSPSRKPRPSPPKISQTTKPKDPNWKLLGIIQGQFGRLAVIQMLSGERIFVEPGLEPIRSGWIIKTISDTEVHLEHASSAATRKGVSQPKTFTLSFPIIGESS